jgi:N-acetylmuramoyl-L-alanine amidase
MIADMKEIKYIVLHTCGSSEIGQYGPKAIHQSFDTVRDYHIHERGFDDIGYHYYIDYDGGIHNGRDYSQAGAHTKGLNDVSLGICVSGHGDLEGWDFEQAESVVDLCAKLCDKYGIPAAHVIGHREAGQYSVQIISKTCPGNLVRMNDVRTLVAEKLREIKLSREKARSGDTQFIPAQKPVTQGVVAGQMMAQVADYEFNARLVELEDKVAILERDLRCLKGFSDTERPSKCDDDDGTILMDVYGF